MRLTPASAMIAATSTMWDALSWGGETQALIYNPHTGEEGHWDKRSRRRSDRCDGSVYKGKGMNYPPNTAGYGEVRRGRRAGS